MALRICIAIGEWKLKLKINMELSASIINFLKAWFQK